MANKTTVALTQAQYYEIIETISNGCAGLRANERVATALVLEANLGMRIDDILDLRLDKVIRDGERYRLDVVEIKTGKIRKFKVPNRVYEYMVEYCRRNKIASSEKMFNMSERNVQQILAKAVEYLGIEEPIGTHSFRKYFATTIYENEGHDIVLVKNLLNHSAVSTTERYININPNMDRALDNHVSLPGWGD